VQLSPFSRYFIPLRSKYSPQHPVVFYTLSFYIADKKNSELHGSKQHQNSVCYYFFVYAKISHGPTDEKYFL
jgi:hypothetical protein